MMTEEDIQERNNQLIALIRELNLGIHVVDLPHKPKLLSSDYQWKLNGYVKNFHLFLKTDETENVFLDIRLKPIEKMNIEEIRSSFLDWMVNYTHDRIYTVSNDCGLFVTGFNFHNKLLKSNPYPVFAKYDPHIYYDIEKANSVVNKFDQYELEVN